MPKGDGTGPNGAGRMTGRGMGYCSGNNTPGYSNPNGTPGYGRGYGNPNGTPGYGRGMDPTFGGVRQPGLGRGRFGYRNWR